jgi:hypothetical protein
VGSVKWVCQKPARIEHFSQQSWRARETKWRRNGRAPKPRLPLTKDPEIYKRPDDRNRETGSATGNAERRKIQRATANPTAA